MMMALRRILFIVFGLACLALAVPDLARSWSMSSWQVAPGKVVASETRQEKAGKRFRYFTDIAVEFSVDGTKHVTRKIRADSALSSSDRSWADRIVGRYDPRVPVAVRYPAGNPDEARVEIDPLLGTWMLLVWGLVALFCGFWRPTPHAGVRKNEFRAPTVIPRVIED